MAYQNTKKQTKKGKNMLRLRILDILTEQNHTKYWLYKQMDLSYQNFNRLVKNETKSIRFENLDALSRILNCPVGDLFEQTGSLEDIPDLMEEH